MEQKEWQKINDIVDTALDLDKEERATYIQKQCKRNKALKKQVTELLASIEESENAKYLEGTDAFPHNLARDLSQDEQKAPGSAMIGKTVGKYKILELIGHGGMGSVFKANRADEAYDKQVAIKILRRGMDTPSNIARFKRERNILANLDHPNIARLLDGGITQGGLPYLVMEYVQGTSLLTYCNNHQLSVPERITLFKAVCQAVQHAHKNAIIHRDLKPSNILVTDEGTIKVLDFGIAKLLDSNDQHSEQFRTRTGARMLTLSYAAPEQLESTAITTATDTYVLGILLFELLAGKHPFNIKKKAFTEIAQTIRKKMPDKPSVKFEGLKPSEQQSIAQSRNTTPSALSRKIKGDLDAIVLKALRKEPQTRYNSTDQLLEDLRRCENDLPIVARKDTIRYNTSKFIKRHKTGITVAAGFFLLVTSFIVFYTWKITQERNKAQIEAQKAKEVSAFLTDMFRASNPNYNPKDTVTAATFLKRGQERIDQLKDQPEVQAKLLDVMGRAYNELGRFDKAKPLIQKSLQLRKSHFGESSIEYAQSLDASVIRQRLMGNFAKAESLTRQSLSIIKAKDKDNIKLLTNGLNELGLILDQRGKYQEADSAYSIVLEMQQQIYEPNNPTLAHTLNNRAGVLRKLGEYQKAEKLYRQALTIWKEKHGDIHPSTSMGYNDLAIALNVQGKLAQAESLYKKALAIDKKLYESPDRHIAQSHNNIGTFYGQQGEYQKAKPHLEKSLRMRRKIYDNQHPRLAESLNNLARLHLELEDQEKARPFITEALEVDRANFGNEHPYVASDLSTLALIEKESGNYEQAEHYYQRSLAIFEDILPGDHRKIGELLMNLGEVLTLQDKTDKALPLLQQALSIQKKSYDKGTWQIAHANIIMGKALTQEGKFNNAEAYLTEGYQVLKKERGSSDRYTQQARKSLEALYEAWEKPTRAQKYKSEK